ncbi:MAG: hypothetical protein AAGI30_09400, partial [Planctomycetota bacterium]
VSARLIAITGDERGRAAFVHLQNADEYITVVEGDELVDRVRVTLITSQFIELDVAGRSLRLEIVR